MLPTRIEDLGVKAYTNLREALDGADVIMALRIQNERLKGAHFPSIREYSATFGLDRAKLRYAADDAIVMHPGPVNRGVELSHELTDHRPSVILDQVRNGVALRMAHQAFMITGENVEDRPVVQPGEGRIRPRVVLHTKSGPGAQHCGDQRMICAGVILDPRRGCRVIPAPHRLSRQKKRGQPVARRRFLQPVGDFQRGFQIPRRGGVDQRLLHKRLVVRVTPQRRTEMARGGGDVAGLRRMARRKV